MGNDSVVLTEEDIERLRTYYARFTQHDFVPPLSYETESDARLHWFFSGGLPDALVRMLWVAEVRELALYIRASQVYLSQPARLDKKIGPLRLMFRGIFLEILDDLKISQGGGRGRKGNFGLAIDHLNRYFDSDEEFAVPLGFNGHVSRREAVDGKYEYRVLEKRELDHNEDGSVNDRVGNWHHIDDLYSHMSNALKDIKRLASVL